MKQVRRCKFTNNPCGTDTWEIHTPCKCEECQAYIMERIWELESRLVISENESDGPEIKDQILQTMPPAHWCDETRAWILAAARHMTDLEKCLPYNELYSSINRLLSYLHSANVVHLVNVHYMKYNNTAPADLIKQEIEYLEEYLRKQRVRKIQKNS